MSKHLIVFLILKVVSAHESANYCTLATARQFEGSTMESQQLNVRFSQGIGECHRNGDCEVIRYLPNLLHRAQQASPSQEDKEDERGRKILDTVQNALFSAKTTVVTFESTDVPEGYSAKGALSHQDGKLHIASRIETPERFRRDSIISDGVTVKAILEAAPDKGQNVRGEMIAPQRERILKIAARGGVALAAQCAQSVLGFKGKEQMDVDSVIRTRAFKEGEEGLLKTLEYSVDCSDSNVRFGFHRARVVLWYDSDSSRPKKRVIGYGAPAPNPSRALKWVIREEFTYDDNLPKELFETPK